MRDGRCSSSCMTGSRWKGGRRTGPWTLAWTGLPCLLHAEGDCITHVQCAWYGFEIIFENGRAIFKLWMARPAGGRPSTHAHNTPSQ